MLAMRFRPLIYMCIQSDFISYIYRQPAIDLSELESLFSAAAPVSNGTPGADKAGGRRASLAPKQEIVHLVG